MFDKIEKYTEFFRRMVSLIRSGEAAMKEGRYADLIRLVGDLAYAAASLLEPKVGAVGLTLEAAMADADVLAAASELEAAIDSFGQALMPAAFAAVGNPNSPQPVKNIATVVAVISLAFQAFKMIREMVRKK